VLLTEALDIGTAELAARPQAPLGPNAAARLQEFARRRLAREPVGRILGRREFWGLPFDLSPATLEPRPDSETVVETALALVADRQAPLRILDLGTGTGCLLVALLHELPRATGLGLDLSLEALRTACHNAIRNGVGPRAAFAASDWTAAVRGPFDLVVSNPPYVASAEVARLPPEVGRYDPAAALDGGADGLAAYAAIFAQAAKLLTPSGALVVEIGSTQEAGVRRLAAAASLRITEVKFDLGGHARAVVLRVVSR
jgi:release factor glutamine methyltransferase